MVYGPIIVFLSQVDWGVAWSVIWSRQVSKYLYLWMLISTATNAQAQQGVCFLTKKRFHLIWSIYSRVNIDDMPFNLYIFHAISRFRAFTKSRMNSRRRRWSVFEVYSVVHFRVSVPIILTKRGRHMCPIFLFEILALDVAQPMRIRQHDTQRKIITPSLGLATNVSFLRIISKS